MIPGFMPRPYSNLSGNLGTFKPAVVYSDTQLQKDKIFQENGGKCGVYR